MKKYNLTEAATELGIAISTLARRLHVLDQPTARGSTFTLKTIVAAMTVRGTDREDLIRARKELIQSQADLAKLDLAQRENDLVSLEEVKSLLGNALLTVRQRLNALPSEMASKTNPTDPEHARAQLNQWVDQALPLIREQLPKIKPEPKPNKGPKAHSRPPAPKD